MIGDRSPGYALHWIHFVLLVLPAMVALIAGVLHGQDFIDDAYITFRYAENLAAGNNLTFNPGEIVLGTSSPMLALLLGFLRTLGVDLLVSARVLGVVGFIGVVIVIQLLCIRSTGRWVGAIVGLCIALHPQMIFSANSGMETSLSMFAVYTTLLLSLRKQGFWAGIAGGAAFLLRPDGGIVILLAILYVLWRQPKRCWQPLLGAGLIAFPWIIFAQMTYGYFLPHSIQAKQLIHADAPLNILMINLVHLTLGWGMKMAVLLTVLGVVFVILRRSEIMLLALWVVVYLVGLSNSRIAPIFPWYITPMIPGLLALAGYGAKELVNQLAIWKRKKSQERFVKLDGLAVIMLIAMALMIMFDSPKWKAAREMFFGHRVSDYMAIGENLRTKCRPGDVIFVGEVGALGYQLLEQVIIDSSGINSPAVYHTRMDDYQKLVEVGIAQEMPDGSPAWVLELIYKFQPRYIVTYKRWLHISYIMGVKGVAQLYRRVNLGIPSIHDYVVLERIER